MTNRWAWAYSKDLAIPALKLQLLLEEAAGEVALTGLDNADDVPIFLVGPGGGIYRVKNVTATEDGAVHIELGA